MNTEKKVLLICGDYYHPESIPSDGLDYLGEYGYTVDEVHDGSALDRKALKGYSSIILARGDSSGDGERSPWYTDGQANALEEYVRLGGGLLAVHAGLTCDSEVIRSLIGCKFLYHPEQRTVKTAPVNRHEITRGIGNIMQTDEHYVVELYETVTPLFASTSENLLNVGGYLKRHGKGKVFALMPGHNIETWHNDEFRKIILNVLEYVS